VKRQLYTLGDNVGDAVASLGLDADGLACVCITSAGGLEGTMQEIWIFGKPALRVLGELALAAQHLKEELPEITPHVLPIPIDTPGEVG
jgi:hypothetical protein